MYTLSILENEDDAWIENFIVDFVVEISSVTASLTFSKSLQSWLWMQHYFLSQAVKRH